MKITDMNLVCLEECFEYLGLSALVNVANANIRLRKAAQSVYFRNYSEMTVSFDVDERYVRCIRFDPICGLSVGDLRNSLQILRCFGRFIKYVWYRNILLRFGEQVLTYLNEYCAESLVMFEFYNVVKDELKPLTKKFTKVQRVVFARSYLLETGWLGRIFPNVKYFKCNGNHNEMAIHNIGCVVDHFPHLERFKFNCRVEILLDSTKEHMASVLRLNPQLKRLYLAGRVTGTDREYFFGLDTFRDIIEPMKNLEELVLFSSFASFSNFTGDKIHLNSIKRFEHFGQNLSYPFLFNQLEFFRMDDDVTENVYNFIYQHPTIKALSFRSHQNRSFTSIIDVSRLMNVIPSLTEIEIDYLELMSVDDVVRLVSSFKLLEKFVIRTSESTRKWRDELRERLGDEWQVPAKYGNEWETSAIYNWWIHLERYGHTASE